MSQYTIFVAEDDEDDQFLLRMAFAATGIDCKLVFFANGQQLINELALSPKPPTLVLLDLNMPVMDGFQTLSHLRDTETYKTIPVLMLTTSTQREDIVRAYSMGANSFITKPNQYAELNQAVEKLQEFWLVTASIP